MTLYNPNTTIYGGPAAAPVFSEVTAYALQYLGIPPERDQGGPVPVHVAVTVRRAGVLDAARGGAGPVPAAAPGRFAS